MRYFHTIIFELIVYFLNYLFHTYYNTSCHFLFKITKLFWNFIGFFIIFLQFLCVIIHSLTFIIFFIFSEFSNNFNFDFLKYLMPVNFFNKEFLSFNFILLKNNIFRRLYQKIKESQAIIITILFNFIWIIYKILYINQWFIMNIILFLICWFYEIMAFEQFLFFISKLKIFEYIMIFIFIVKFSLIWINNLIWPTKKSIIIDLLSYFFLNYFIFCQSFELNFLLLIINWGNKHFIISHKLNSYFLAILNKLIYYIFNFSIFALI